MPAREAFHLFGAGVVQLDANGNALLYFDEVAGGVISRNQGVLGTGCFGDGGNCAVKDMPAESIEP